MSLPIATFNAPGIPSGDFLVEINDSVTRKKNALFFALSAQGLAGDPDFGVGLYNLAWASLQEGLGNAVSERLTELLPTYIDNIKVDNVTVTLDTINKALRVSVVVIDLDTGATIPLAVGIERGSV